MLVDFGGFREPSVKVWVSAIGFSAQAPGSAFAVSIRSSFWDTAETLTKSLHPKALLPPSKEDKASAKDLSPTSPPKGPGKPKSCLKQGQPSARWSSFPGVVNIGGLNN